MERRKYTRKEVRGNVRGRIILIENLEVIDLSLSGIRFNCFKRVNPNSKLKIMIQLDDISVILKGTVVRSTLKNINIEGEPLSVYEVAMTFHSLRDHEMRSLEELIGRLNNG